MNRCLHITIHESPNAAPQHTTASLPGWAQTSTDPEGDPVMPPVDDPEGDPVMPPVDDPNGIGLASAVAGAAYTSTYGVIAAPLHTCCCREPAGSDPAKGTITPNPFVAPREHSGFVIVRMAEGVVGNSPAENLWTLAELQTPKLTGLQSVLELSIKTPTPTSAPQAAPQIPGLGFKLPGSGKANPPDRPTPPEKDKPLLPEPPSGILVSRPLVELLDRACRPLARTECLGILREMEKKASTTPLPPLHSLTSYWRIDARMLPDLIEQVVSELNRLPEVDLAWRELAAVDSQITTEASGKVFAEDQGYFEDAPVGISAPWAWQSLNGSLSKLGSASLPPSFTLCDLEQGWNPTHQDLMDSTNKPLVAPVPLYGANRALDDNNPGHHGTAVLGQLVAAGTFGVKGAASGLGKLVLASHYKSKTEKHPFAGTNGHVAAAIAQALAKSAGGPLGEGDVLLLEVQRGRLPTEVDDADFDAIRLAAGQGVIVIEAAGNGGFDLDRYSDPGNPRTLRRGASHFRDSGAVFVGAARAALPHDRAPFSNYGSRLDCFAWGETVTTCGYGDLAGTGAADFYTNSFSGTSSASPIIAGAAALLQALHRKAAGVGLGPLPMRAVLSDPATGTRQGTHVAGHIGVMPDLKAIIRERLQLVPDVYVRRSVGDDGSAPHKDDEISSSPDILVWKEGIVKTSARYGEGNLRDSFPAPGDPFNATAANDLYVRLRNRGLGEGEAHVQLFASPASTLITPERWIPMGSLKITKNPQVATSGSSLIATFPQLIPQGDTLLVAGPIPVPANKIASPYPDTAWSFLAIVSRPGDNIRQGPPYFFDWAVGLPPGPPYFDWAEYRAFLRGPGVAWRNTHRVKVGSALRFCIAGTPDRAREFDFEITQRLPANATVTLTAPPALTAKLRQRQPLLVANPQGITLPSRPRTKFSRVQLAACTCADATFKVAVDPNFPLGSGHSLGIRQLWNGEEVGRITWYFTLDT